MKLLKKIILITIIILFFILCIRFAVMVYSNITGTVTYETMHDAEVQYLNEKFKIYEGRKRSSELIKLIDEVNEHDKYQKQINNDEYIINIVIDGKQVDDLINKEIVDLDSMYDIEMKYNNDNFIYQINVNKVK